MSAMCVRVRVCPSPGDDWRVRTHMSLLLCLFLHYVGVTRKRKWKMLINEKMGEAESV